MRFSELWTTDLSAAEEDERVHRLFPALVAKSRLHLWKPGDKIVGNRILIGVSLQSLQDLLLLDVLDQALDVRRPSKFHGRSARRVDVFPFLDARRIDEYVPGMCRAAELGVTICTPITGCWNYGELVHKRWGERAIEWLEAFFAMHLQWDSTTQQWAVTWDVIIE